MVRPLLRLAAAVGMISLILLALGYRQATADPIVRTASIALKDWPQQVHPLRVVLLSDLHVIAPDMTPARLARIVAQVNRLSPDLVLIAGDFTGDKAVSLHHYPVAQIVAPLAGLRARLGTVAVLGNHDHWGDAGAFPAALRAAGITLLANNAVRRGPLTIAGADDPFVHKADLKAMTRAAAALPDPALVLAHSPDIAPQLDPRFTLLLAGHTHCGQIALPFYGPLATASRYGRRYACGMIREGPRTTIVGAGLGTSMVPLRWGVPPDFWLITLSAEEPI